MKNPYEVLGVSKTANDQEIKKAYKELAKKEHPDRNPGDAGSAERFKDIKEAYEKIKTAEAREELERENLSRQYAGRGFEGFAGGASPRGAGNFRFSEGGMDEEIFREFFGNFGSRAKAPTDETVSVSLDFWDAVVGGSQTIILPDGSRLEVSIPAGIKSGQKIRLKGQASKVNSFADGDLFLKVNVKETKTASFKGDDLHVLHDLPVDLAVTGGETVVSCPLGNFQVKIPPYTNSGAKFRLKGKAPKGADFIVTINLVLPKEKRERLQRCFQSKAA